MKTSIVQIETHDDYISVRDRLNWIKGGRVLLIWPKRARALERRLDLVLLQHHATSLGLQLGLVTKDPEVRSHAEELGIPAFDSTRQAQTERWARRRRNATRIERRRPQPDIAAMRQQNTDLTARWAQHPLVRGSLFTLAILSVLALALLLIPEASITLTPATRTQTLRLDVSASPSTQTITLAGNLPARPVSVIVDGYAVITATGSITVPAGYASGSVKFTNLSNTPLTIPAGSVVSTLDLPPVRFATRQKGEISTGPGSSITLSVVALTAGAEGNVKVGQIATLEGPLSFQVAITNPGATRGGSHAFAIAPSPDDYRQLYEELGTQLEQSATEALRASLLPGDELIATAVLSDTIEEIYVPSQAQPSDQLALTLRLQFAGLAVSGRDLEQWAEAVMDANLPVGYTPILDSLNIVQITTPSLETGLPAQWQIEAQRNLQAQVSTLEAAMRSRWLPIHQAEQALEALPLSASAPPTIRLSPPWWPFVPLRIQVNIP